MENFPVSAINGGGCGTKFVKESLLWSLIVILSLGSFCYLAYDVTNEFCDHPTAFDWSVRPLEESPLISVYFHNVINSSTVESMGLSKLHIKYILSHIRLWTLTQEDLNELLESDLLTLQKDIDEVRTMYNLSMFELLDYSKYSRNSLMDVNVEATIYELSVGIFRIMVSKGQVAQTKDHLVPYFSFDVKNLAREDPYVQDADIDSRAFFIYIGDSYISGSAGLSMAPNTVNTIVLTPESFHLLNRPNNPCREDERLQERCSWDCYDNFDECRFNCTWWTNSSGKSEQPYCTDIMKLRTNGTFGDDSCSQINMLCLQHCAIPACRFWRYNEKVLHITALQQSIHRYGNITNRNTVLLSESWRAMVHEEKYLYRWSRFFSDVAGLMGLFFGGSVVSASKFGCYCFRKLFAKRQSFKLKDQCDQSKDVQENAGI